jgi:murein DD-endopeptidase MepM/ murein hydrolase activator NlpD
VNENLVVRKTRVALAVGAVITLVLVCCGGGISAVLLGGLLDNHPDESPFGCGSNTLIDPNAKVPPVADLREEQARNAAVIVSVGQQLKVPPRGWVIAIATALQESNLINLGNLGSQNDHDSLGLFQQRPSEGWGTPAQIMDPRYSSTKFYQKLLTISGWERLPLTEAAQRVQISAFPDAYAKHETKAAQIVNILTNGAARAVGGLFDLRCTAIGEISAAGWTQPLRGKIVSAFRPPSRPTHYGVDLAANRNTVVHAASAGVVVQMRCDAHTADGGFWGCDRDGSPAIKGCGWYVDIMHAGRVMTRYCHMNRQPDVVIGQNVTAGQAIGLSGTTGNSSGPHLHFEVHLNGDHTNAGAIDPEPFMREVGAPLGDGTP